VKKTIGGAKNGGSREVDKTAPKFYPADDIDPLKSTGISGIKAPAREAKSKGVAKLRKSIAPGTVVILLAGRFRGRRCVFLKQLASGLLLVTGPYSVNGIPLRRVNQSYVIATSTKVDIKAVKADKFNDAYFGKAKVPRSQKKKSGDDMMEDAAPAATGATDARKADQAAVDKAIKADPLMSKYLKARFSLSKGDKPHNMVF